MTSINNISIGTRISFNGEYYIITNIKTNVLIAKSLYDGTDRTFTESDFKNIKIWGHYIDTGFIAVDRDGLPAIYPDKPVRDDHGNWHCYEDYMDGYIEVRVPISWKLMQKITGKTIMTSIDEPVELK